MIETTTRKEEEAELGANNASADVLHHLLKPDVHEALTAVVANLPKLAEMTALLTQAYDLAKQASGDRVLMQDTLGGIKEVVKPLEEKAKHYASAAIEARHRAEQEKTSIGLIGMLRLLKHPEFQRVLRFGQAYLDILGARRK
ncbi:DUF1641 domain-containing protein [Paenibacillus glycinis]|uniref:DUF1641 domain-containing protein n=1 Tax=Paenibacillus glycinis TaxID=2697035 RepID=A0ABW9XR98_9BACL|nr:DUF1641 domain-containing protein [Paenibacillus glycinis]NBD24882.1 DUF1641 domain-containing protein [Paenibacillus glycinis]